MCVCVCIGEGVGLGLGLGLGFCGWGRGWCRRWWVVAQWAGPAWVANEEQICCRAGPFHQNPHPPFSHGFSVGGFWVVSGWFGGFPRGAWNGGTQLGVSVLLTSVKLIERQFSGPDQTQNRSQLGIYSDQSNNGRKV